jgi:hypothetical protein
MGDYVKRLPYTEQLVTEIFGAYIFERDTALPGYKLINACQLGIPPHVRADFFKLVKPLGHSNYVRLLKWLYSDTVMLKINKASLKKLDKFLAEQLSSRLSDYIPEHDEVYTPPPGERVLGFLNCDDDRAKIAVMRAKDDGAISDSQLSWLYDFHYPTKKNAIQFKLPG